MSHSDKKGSKGKRSWGRGQQDANAAPRREADAGNHNPGQGAAVRSTATKAPVGLWLARGSHPVGMSTVVAAAEHSLGGFLI